jgi:hypothetical protein
MRKYFWLKDTPKKFSGQGKVVKIFLKLFMSDKNFLSKKNISGDLCVIKIV